MAGNAGKPGYNRNGQWVGPGPAPGTAGAGSPNAPDAPDTAAMPSRTTYTNAAEQTSNSAQANANSTAIANRWDEVGPTGSVSWRLKPGVDPANATMADYVRETSLAPGQQQLLDNSTGLSNDLSGWARGAIGDLQPDAAARDRLTQSLYDRNTQFYDRRFDRDQAGLESKLLNSGLAKGSEAWNEALTTFGENKNTAYADATDRAVIGAETQSRANQDSAMARLTSGLAGIRGGMPAMPQSENTGQVIPTGGTDYFTAIDRSATAAQGGLQRDLDSANANSARTSATRNAGLQTAGMVALAYF